MNHQRIKPSITSDKRSSHSGPLELIESDKSYPDHHDKKITSLMAASSDNIHSRRGAIQEVVSTRCNNDRWRAHKITEDYMEFVGNIMLPNINLSHFGYAPGCGKYPVERITMLGLLQSPLRRRCVVETWNPLEISTFEAALAVYGKVFHQIQKFIKTKSTKEIIEFYYVWKKTQHYKIWKQQYISPDDLDSDEDL